MKTKYELIAVICCYVSLVGFGEILLAERPDRAVEASINRIQSNAQPSKNLDLGSLPNIEKYNPYVYSSPSDKDPFILKAFVSRMQTEEEMQEQPISEICDNRSCDGDPPAPHEPYFLENYELSQLAMVGFVINRKNCQSSHEDSCEKIALISTPDAGIIEARKGEYMGRDNGLIMEIHKDHMTIKEAKKVPGGWQNPNPPFELIVR
ncbi:pilus assembly protein PilP [Dichelobacter nodosus]|uniref:Type IV fimbrial biogenesis protein PilP n=1 Tax=Dichelobacter nodosus (strain VCS1703A) TaxID=246195 RepID=A5EW43_DICNV|nr:pilus assembly protein PilP [Dichelobacter nodosus]ABQ13908.1 type IV fimbrial biogenesis protein PilP [Dichelobacter nodosus VCS1703A]AXM45244.1 hypothetical protein DYQ38_01705 [Dichelobacter nodosus]KNZ39361.1 hypothetical protein AKG33_04470 [Dichelobacter nodosus]TGA65459.1 hypothetical protein E5E99_03285 [Dichelobacter nodosus]